MRAILFAVLLWIAALGTLLAQESPTPSPTPSAAQPTQLSVLIDIRYCLLFSIGIALYAVGVSAWGHWHKGQ